MAVGFIGFRIYFMGNKPPEFAPADNPASDSESLLTRTLTFTYLPFLNFWLLLFPNVLSFDWSMEAVPLLERLTDLRNVCTLLFYGVLVYVGVYMARHLNRTVCPRGGAGAASNGNGHAPHSHSPSSSPAALTSTPTSASSSTSSSSSSTASASAQASFASASPALTSPAPRGWPRRRHFRRRGSTSSTGSDDDAPATGSGLAALLPPLSADQREHQRTLHVLVMALALMVFPFLPAANIFFYVGFVLAERVLYIPSMGFCLLVAHGAGVMYDRCWRDAVRRQLVVVAVGCIVCLYGARTVLRNRDWLSEENLYKSGVHVNPAKGE